jgi:hypothetical protein
MAKGKSAGKSATVQSPIQLQKFLGGVDYPAKKADIIAHARDHGADERVLDTLQALPSDDFNSPNDISEAFGKMR